MRSNDNLQSKTIDALRFPLIIGVVFIHSYGSSLIIHGSKLGTDLNFVMNDYIQNFFSQVLGRISVPMFLMISGYLFFYKTEWNTSVYLQKMKRRVKTLLLPYLFWNALAVLYSYIITLPVCKSLFPGAFAQGFHYSLIRLLQDFWNVPPYTLPIAGQFWFIRDLMVMVLVSPVIYWLIKYTRCVGVVILGILWYMDCMPGRIPGLSSVAIFFFSAGAALSIAKVNLVDLFRRLSIISFITYPVLAIIDLLTTQGDLHINWIHNAGILVGILMAFNLTSFLLVKNKIKVNLFLCTGSFFVFAVHQPVLLEGIRKILFSFFKPDSDLLLIIVYFFTVSMVLGVSLSLYYFLQKYLPGFTKVIIGGR